MGSNASEEDIAHSHNASQQLTPTDRVVPSPPSGRPRRWAVGVAVPRPAIALSSLRRWPTKVTPMLIRSRRLASAAPRRRYHFRGTPTHSAQAPNPAARPLRPCCDPRAHRSDNRSSTTIYLSLPSDGSILTSSPRAILPTSSGGCCGFRPWSRWTLTIADTDRERFRVFRVCPGLFGTIREDAKTA